MKKGFWHTVQVEHDGRRGRRGGFTEWMSPICYPFQAQRSTDMLPGPAKIKDNSMFLFGLCFFFSLCSFVIAS